MLLYTLMIHIDVANICRLLQQNRFTRQKLKICRPRPVPFAIKESVGNELDRLTEAGIVSSNQDYSEWAAPIVPVVLSQSAGILK